MRTVRSSWKWCSVRCIKMSPGGLRIVILGLSITSSWGNGHSTTYRSLIKALTSRGHTVLFLERDVPWYAENRDLPNPPYGRTCLYSDLSSLKKRFSHEVREADLVIVGSYVPEGTEVGEWVIRTARGLTAFYDIDTPVTLAGLKNGDRQYISRELIPQYQMYLSFTGGPILETIERKYKSPFARALYCSVDPAIYSYESRRHRWDLGYMGTHSPDRQPVLDKLMLNSARRWKKGSFVVVGALYPEKIKWPSNLARIEHLPPSDHRAFYNSQRFTLNVTRAAMVRSGYSPSVRLFEAAACATPIISDYWEGLESFFDIGREILISRSSSQTIEYIRYIPEEERRLIGERARARVLARHTAIERARDIESYVALLRSRGAQASAEAERHIAGPEFSKLRQGFKQISKRRNMRLLAAKREV